MPKAAIPVVALTIVIALNQKWLAIVLDVSLAADHLSVGEHRHATQQYKTSRTNWSNIAGTFPEALRMVCTEQLRFKH